jgi:multiple sugar transport system substrate-binding protein
MWFEKFQKENPDIKIEYSLFTIDAFKQSVLLAVNSGDAPDIFPIPVGLTFAQAVSEGWHQPMDDYIEKIWPGGLKAFKEGFPPGSFLEGVNMWEGKIYHVPRLYPAGGGGAQVFFNRSHFRTAGLNPGKGPATYGEMRTQARKITEAGKGEYFGFIMGGKQLNRWESKVGHLAQTAGPVTTAGLNYMTGRYEVEGPAVTGAMDLVLQMRDDGSYYPGFLSINAPDARARFGLGAAGFIVQGRWCPGVWVRDNPDLDFGVSFPPVPDSGRKAYYHGSSVAEGGGDPWSLSVDSKVSEQAMRVFLSRWTRDYMVEYVKSGDGFAVYPELNTKETIPIPQMYDIFRMDVEEVRVPPSPLLRNPEGVGQVMATVKEIHPNFREIAQGAFAGQIDFRTAAKALSDQMNAELDRAIKEVQAQGVDVSRDDWVFPNWDPMQNYLDEDYKALK